MLSFFSEALLEAILAPGAKGINIPFRSVWIVKSGESDGVSRLFPSPSSTDYFPLGAQLEFMSIPPGEIFPALSLRGQCHVKNVIDSLGQGKL